MKFPPGVPKLNYKVGLGGTGPLFLRVGRVILPTRVVPRRMPSSLFGMKAFYYLGARHITFVECLTLKIKK